MPTATPINDTQKRPWKLVQTVNGYRGVKYYRVDTENLSLVHTATGLPRIGDPWDQSLMGVRVISVNPQSERPGGEWMIVEVTYENDTGQIPEAGMVNTTAITQSSTSEMIKHDLQCKEIASEKERGEPKMLTVIMYEVTQYFDTLPDLMPFRLLSDEPKINLNPVLIKNIFGSGQNEQIEKEQLLYAGFSVEPVGDLFAIIHQLHWRRDWRPFRRKEDATGKCLDDNPDNILYFDIYEKADFSGVI